MEQFRKGLLYMNTLNYFRGLDGDPARADRYEGVTHIFQPKRRSACSTRASVASISDYNLALRSPRGETLRNEN